MCLWNTMSPYMTFDLVGWPWPFTTQNVQLHEIHMHFKYKIASFNIAEVTLHAQFWPIYLTFDLEGWPWPFTTQNVQLHEIHMHAKYQVAIFNIAKVIANVKVGAKQQTNQQTGQKQYVPHYYSGPKHKT